MRSDRSYVIWVPRNGSGKARTFLISPFFIRLFSFIVLLCICSVPFLETGLLSLSRRITDLEQKKDKLEEEILRFQYVRRALARIEEKEKMLRNYFGMERYKSLEQVVGGGGELNLGLSRVGHDKEKNGDEYDDYPVSDTTLPGKFQALDSNYEILNQLMVKKEDAWENTPSIVPVSLKKPRISSGFGWRTNPFTNRREFHAGIDIIGPEGTRIIAPARGIAITKGYDRWLGNYLVVQHTDEIKTIYGHLEKISVGKGIQVKRGDLLGIMGNTGLSTSRHLHYGVVMDDRAVNPMQFILDMKG